ncbi:hypothetical protein SAMN04487958_10149 [Vreelandella subterranea]|uniref:Uncharacterized protein n=1 Tax=Vreelandella subterranea TaxID=416874 RepID=A0A1H9P0N5_9GAMM|nr:hypothetical protein [Halomonas subterranea]SER41844.1 hypothetical protein SAMN04487958_10149 [Halomonas subterranea]
MSQKSISAHEVMYDLIPKLNALERQINNTLEAMITAGQSPAEKESTEKLKIEFELELTMIRMNLQHLLSRYRTELEAVTRDDHHDVTLALDKHETVAVESAKALYDRVQRLQQGQ